MENKLGATELQTPSKRKLVCRNDSSTIQLSVSVVLVFFAWFFILPTNVCSYAYVLADNFLISEARFIMSSNVTGLLGLLIGGVLLVLKANIKRFLLILLSLLNLFNLLIFAVSPQLGLYFMILQYFLLGVYVTLASYLFFINTMKYRRYLFTGSILASIIFITSFFKRGTDGVSAGSIFTMNLILSLVILVFVLMLNANHSSPHSEKSIQPSNKPSTGIIFLQYAYTIILSITLGYLTNERELSIAASPSLSSFLNAIP